jgi:tetratricopeptide (TPR) repeat protein
LFLDWAENLAGPNALLTCAVSAAQYGATLPPRRILALLLFASLPAHAQLINSRAPVDVVGQVHAPTGGPLQQNVRIHFQSDDGFRPPEIVFSDSNGRFVLQKLSPDVSYTITVEGDGKNWETTVVRFMPMGRRPSLQIYLKAMERKVVSGPGAVSAVELSQDVPKAARKEFEAALELITNGQTDQGRALLLSAIDTFPNFVEAHNELAVLMMKGSDLAGAETHLRRAVAINPAAPLPLLNLALCLQRQQRYSESLSLLRKAVQLQPANAKAHLMLGLSLMKTQAFDQAEPALLRAYELGGARTARAQYYLSWMYTQRKDFERAAAALEIFLRDSPDDPDAEALQLTLARLRAANTPNPKP